MRKKNTASVVALTVLREVDGYFRKQEGLGCVEHGWRGVGVAVNGWSRWAVRRHVPRGLLFVILGEKTLALRLLPILAVQGAAARNFKLRFSGATCISDNCSPHQVLRWDRRVMVNGAQDVHRVCCRSSHGLSRMQ